MLIVKKISKCRENGIACLRKGKLLRRQLKINANTAVDWDSFCREACEASDDATKEGKKSEDRAKQSKLTKVKSAKGSTIAGIESTGQWVFGGIEEDTRKCFLSRRSKSH